MPRRINYLRTHRKRCGLSQTDVAFVLGAHGGSKVSRYEWQHRTPPLPTVLALEILFHAPARDLFGGLYAEIERATLRRIAQLATRVERCRPGQLRDHRLAALRGALDRARTSRS